MAILVSRATGNWLSSGTWKVGTTATAGNVTTLSAVQSISAVAQYSPNITGNDDVVEGVLLRIGSRIASPTAGNKLYVLLRNVTDATNVEVVTMLISDISINANGWYFIKFSTPRTLTTGKNWAIGLLADVATQMGCYRGPAGSTDWVRVLVTTTNQAPVAADRTFVVGEVKTSVSTSASAFVVTCDETATTDYGEVQVSEGGTLAPSTSVTTNLRLSGNIQYGCGGVLGIGTNGSRATGKIEFNCTSNQQYGVTCMAGGVSTKYGVPKTCQSLLNASAASGQANLTLADTTGWVSGDSISIPATNQTWNSNERRTVLSSSGTTVTCTSNLSNTHNIRNDGTYDTRSPVVNSTRSFVITAVGNFSTYYTVATGGNVYAEYIEFRKCIMSVTLSTGSFVKKFCSNWDNNGVVGTTLFSLVSFASGCTFQVEDSYFGDATGGNGTNNPTMCVHVAAASALGAYFRRCTIRGGIGAPSSTNGQYNGGGITCFSTYIELTDLWVDSCFAYGVWLYNSGGVGTNTTIISGARVHSIGGGGASNASGSGIGFCPNLTPGAGLYTTYEAYFPVIYNCKVWHCSGSSPYGIVTTPRTTTLTIWKTTIDSCECFGNAGANFAITAYQPAGATVMKNCISRVGIDFASPAGIALGGGSAMKFIGCQVLGDYSTASVTISNTNFVHDYAFLNCNIDHTTFAKKFQYGNMDNSSNIGVIYWTYGGANYVFQKFGTRTGTPQTSDRVLPARQSHLRARPILT